ncbi:hypothetical protein [Streptantibioticus cattleyicolor]|nr:hypothetical protein [Streptantibioticus cattleyicolor]CCB72188.1 conserved exported protein of unknown function [Streptantibioticus cattleyicolor NRRL 8057 = DSM 46488]
MTHKTVKTAVTAALSVAAALGCAVQAGADEHTMPDVKGHPLVAAYRMLDHHGATVHAADALGHRHVLWPAHWKVCAQEPAPGTRIAGHRITLTVAKNDEACPGR